MSRHARKASASGIYHIMLKGNERKKIFLDDEDRRRFLDTLERMRDSNSYKLLAYCLMDNHVHLLMWEGKEILQRSMKRVAVSYVHYFNKKYKRTGHLFQDRYRSEAVEDDAYVLAAVRYIHNNPVKATMVTTAEGYRWSSYRDYVRDMDISHVLVDKGFILSMFSVDETIAVKEFREYSNTVLEDDFLDCDEVSEEEKKEDSIPVNLQEEVTRIMDKYSLDIEKLKGCKDKEFRNTVIRELKEATGASVRELSKLLGISKDIIFRV